MALVISVNVRYKSVSCSALLEWRLLAKLFSSFLGVENKGGQLRPQFNPRRVLKTPQKVQITIPRPQARPRGAQDRVLGVPLLQRPLEISRG